MYSASGTDRNGIPVKRNHQMDGKKNRGHSNSLVTWLLSRAATVTLLLKLEIKRAIAKAQADCIGLAPEESMGPIPLTQGLRRNLFRVFGHRLQRNPNQISHFLTSAGVPTLQQTSTRKSVEFPWQGPCSWRIGQSYARFRGGPAETSHVGSNK